MHRLEAFLEMLAAERGAARLTIAAYRNDLADFARFMAGRGGATERATGDDLRGYLGALTRARLSPRTASRRLSTLRQFHKFLLLEGVRRDDPTTILDAPLLGRPLPKILAEQDVRRLLEAAGAVPGAEGKRLLCLVELLYATGLRVSELVGLPLAVASPERRTLVVRGKGGKERLVPLSEPAANPMSKEPVAFFDAVSAVSVTVPLLATVSVGVLVDESVWKDAKALAK